MDFLGKLQVQDKKTQSIGHQLNTQSTLRSYIVLIIISFLALFVIGLIPLRIVLSDQNIGIGGFYVAFLAFLLWIPAAFISSLLYVFFQSKCKLPMLSVKNIILVATIINVQSLFSFWFSYPTLNFITDQARNNIHIKVKILEESMEQNNGISNYLSASHIYKYKLEVVNLNNTTFKDVPIEISVGFLTNYQYLGFFMPVSIGDNGFIYTFPKGKTILSGVLPVSPRNEDDIDFNKYPVKVELKIKEIPKILANDLRFYATPNKKIEKIIRNISSQPRPTVQETTPFIGDFSNLNAALSLGSASFNFDYSGYSNEYYIDTSTVADFHENIYYGFAKGLKSPIITRTTNKNADYICGATIFWKVRDQFKHESDIMSSIVECAENATTTIYATPSYAIQ